MVGTIGATHFPLVHVAGFKQTIAEMKNLKSLPVPQAPQLLLSLYEPFGHLQVPVSVLHFC
jgi:hypothetical protein